MQGTFWIVNSDEKYGNFLTELAGEYKKHRYLKIQVRNGKKRTLNQNDMSFEQYTRIGEQLYGGDTELARRECKLEIGVPILRRDEEKFRDIYDKYLRSASYEEKMELMGMMQVTSLFTTTQHKEYIDRTFDKYADRVQWGDLSQGQSR